MLELAGVRPVEGSSVQVLAPRQSRGPVMKSGGVVVGENSYLEIILASVAGDHISIGDAECRGSHGEHDGDDGLCEEHDGL